MLKVTAGLLLIASAILLIASQQFNFRYWLKAPSERLQQQINTDWKSIQGNKATPLEIKNISEVKFSSDSSEAKDWIRQIKIPEPIDRNGRYRLEVFMTQWIDGHDYGAVVQYDLVNQKTNNTVWELSRTYKIGFIY